MARTYKTGVLVTGDATGGVKAIELTKEKLKSLNETTRRVSKEGSDSFGLLTRSMGLLAAAAGGISLASLGRDVVRVGQEMQSIERTFKAVTGSAEAAGKEFEFVREEANRLGLEVATTSRSYAQFAAAAKGTALEGEKSRKVFISISEAARTLGLDSASAEGALRALSQMVSKGTVQAEELRGQLGERLPGAFQLAARAMGVSTQELGKMLEKGEVLADDLLPNLAEEMDRSFGAGLEDAMNSSTAAIARLENAFTELKLAVANSGVLETLTEAAQFWADAINNTISALKKINAESEGDEIAGRMLDLQKKRLDLVESIKRTETILKNFAASNAASESITGGIKSSLQEMKEELTLVNVELWKTNKRALELGSAISEGTVPPVQKLGDTLGGSNKGSLKSGLTDAQKEAKKFKESFESLRDKLDPTSAKTRVYIEQIELLDRAWTDGLISGEEHERLIFELATDYDAVKKNADAATKAEEARAKALQKVMEGQVMEGQAREIQKTADTIERSLTDSLMRSFESGSDFAEAFRDNVENLFKTLILRPIIQATVSPIANSIAGALGGGPGGPGLNLISMAGSGLQALGGTSALGTFGAGMQAGTGALTAGGFGGAYNLSSGLLGAGHTAMGIGAAMPFALPILGIGAALLGGIFKDEPDPRFNVGGALGNVGITGTQDIKGDQQQVVDQLVATIDAFEDQFLSLLTDAERQAIAESGGKDLEKIHIESEHELTGAIIIRLKDAIYAIDGELGEVMHDAIQEIRKTRPHSMVLADADALVQEILLPYVTVREALDNLSLSLDGGDLAQASQAIVEAAGGIDAYQTGITSFFDAFYTQAERFEIFSGDLSESLSILGVDAIPASRDAFRALVESIDLTTVAGQELHGALIAVTPALASFYDQTEQLADQLSGLMQGVDDELASFGTSEFQRGLRGIARWLDETTEKAREYGASQAELSRIQQVAALRTRETITNLQTQISGLVEQLYGRGVGSSSIDSLVQQEQTRLSELNTLARDLYSQELARYQLASRSADQLDDFLANLAVGNLSPSTPLQQYQGARSEYDQTLAAARAGDQTALGDITGRFNNLLTTSQLYNASSQAYVDDYERGKADLLALARDLGAIVEPTEPADITTSQILNSLESRRKLAEQENARADRQALAQELVRGLSDMGIALDQSVIDLAIQNGIDLRQLATDLGVDLNTLDRSLALNLIEAARSTGEHLETVAAVLGVDLERLAANVGVDLSSLSGDLSSDLAMVADSLGVDVRWLAGAFGQSVDGLDNQVHADMSALINAVNALPPDQQAALAPYLTSISNASLAAGRDTLAAIDFFVRAPGWAEAGRLLQSINTNTRHTVEQTYGVRQNLRNMAGAMGVRSYEVGTDFVPYDQVARIHRGEMIIDPVNSDLLRRYGVGTQNNQELVRELRELRAAVARLQAQLSHEHAQSVDQRGAIARAQLTQGARLADGMTPRASARAVA